MERKVRFSEESGKPGRSSVDGLVGDRLSAEIGEWRTLNPGDPVSHVTTDSPMVRSGVNGGDADNPRALL